MRSKADETLVIVETLICPLQISNLIRGVFSMHARHALHALPIVIQSKKINNNIFEKISKKFSRF